MTDGQILCALRESADGRGKILPGLRQSGGTAGGSGPAGGRKKHRAPAGPGPSSLPALSSPKGDLPHQSGRGKWIALVIGLMLAAVGAGIFFARQKDDKSAADIKPPVTQEEKKQEAPRKPANGAAQGEKTRRTPINPTGRSPVPMCGSGPVPEPIRISWITSTKGKRWKSPDGRTTGIR